MTDVRTVRSKLGQSPVRDLRTTLAFIEKELRPFLSQVRLAINEFLPRPRVPIHAVAPVTDLDVDPTGSNPPQDGYISFSSVDGSLYVRNGSSTHQQVL